MKIRAKPTIEISLEEHKNNVIKEAQEILESLPFTVHKYKILTSKDLSKRVISASKFHDLGKKHRKWQEACWHDYKIFCDTNDLKKLKYLKKVRFRHEIASLTHKMAVELSDPVKIAIASHHSNLSHGKTKKWDNNYSWNNTSINGKQIFNEFEGIQNEVTKSKPRVERLKKAVMKRYEYSGPRALLQLADHRASAKEENTFLPNLHHFKYKFPHKNKKGVQKIISELQDYKFAILRAETGSGKTDSALLWAQHQINNRRAERLIIAMPTRFTANSLAISSTENLSKLGIYHSTSWFNSGKDKTDYTIKEQELARLLYYPTIVTTIDHLLISLTGSREDHYTIFFNLSNSCLVIDEADFYDEFTQHNILVLIKILSILKVPILLMSATIPNSLADKYCEYYYGTIVKKCVFEVQENLHANKFNLKKFGSYKSPSDLSSILEKGLEGEPLIIYANTVRKAQQYYDWFNTIDPDFTNRKIVQYHSRFTEPDKIDKEKKLTEMLGKDAWGSNRASGIAILTQIGELSVNISSDLMISDICPIDRLIQRAGRLSRFKNDIGQLFLVNPLKKNKDGLYELYPAPYGTFNSSTKKWDSSDLLYQTQEFMKNKDYKNRELFDLVNKIYSNYRYDTASCINNSDLLRKLFIDNWLILPSNITTEDDKDVNDWKARNISSRFSIYANLNVMFGGFYNCFSNWMEFREFEIKHKLDFYGYEFHKAKKLNVIFPYKVYIDDEEIEIWIVENNYYDSKIGLNMDFLDNKD